MRLLALLLLPIVVLAGCDLPKDPEGTSADVEGKVLRVGVLQPEPDPADRAAVEAVAEAFGAEVELIVGPAHDLIARLEGGELHIVAGGIPADTPFTEKAGLTRPFGTVMIGGQEKDRVLAIPKGENGFLARIEHALPEMEGN